jgi:CPA2 family monovalent cation:H+ antiporter-2
MEGHTAVPYLREAIIFLAAAGIVVPLFHRLRASPVLGYLAVGGLIGPYGLAQLAPDLPLLSTIVIGDLAGVKALAELGVIFLLFMIGLELSFERVWAMRRLVFGLGGLQVAVTAAAIGGVAWAFGNTPLAALVLGTCLALSSTAIVMQLLMQRRQVATPVGRTAFAILLMQDLMVAPLLFLVGVDLDDDSQSRIVALLLALGSAVAVILVIYVAGRLLLRPLLRFVAQSRSPDLMMAAILLIVIGFAALADQARLSMALGAFLAGLLLAETEYRHEIEADIEPFKGLLLGLFFLSVGMGIDWAAVAERPGWLVLSVLGLFAIKAVVIVLLALAFRLPRHTAIETGLLLGQGGEFAFVVLSLAAGRDLLPPASAQFMLMVVSLTMAATPLVAAVAARLGRRLAHRTHSRDHGPRNDDMGELEGHVVLAGYGRVGQVLAAALRAEGIAHIALDADAATVAAARHRGEPVWYGDASRPELIRHARAAKAGAVVVTMDDAAAAAAIVHEMARTCPQVPIHVRARDRAQADRLRRAGAANAVPETVEASLQLTGSVLRELGLDRDAVERRLALAREGMQ